MIFPKGFDLSDRRPVEQFENCSVYFFASGSRPGLRHVTLLLPVRPGEDLDVRCTCEGYQNFEYCWHRDWVLENA